MSGECLQLADGGQPGTEYEALCSRSTQASAFLNADGSIREALSSNDRGGAESEASSMFSVLFQQVIRWPSTEDLVLRTGNSVLGGRLRVGEVTARLVEPPPLNPAAFKEVRLTKLSNSGLRDRSRRSRCERLDGLDFAGRRFAPLPQIRAECSQHIAR